MLLREQHQPHGVAGGLAHFVALGVGEQVDGHAVGILAQLPADQLGTAQTREDIDHNAQCFKRQMERFIAFGEGKAQMVNNADWLLGLCSRGRKVSQRTHFITSASSTLRQYW